MLLRAAAAFLLFLQTPDYSGDGLKALQAGNYDAAVQAFTKAIAADASDYYAHFNLAMAYSLLHKDDEGIAEYRKTIELKPRLYEAELNESILLLRQKNPADAVTLLEDAVSQKPREFRPRFYLAEAQAQAGSLEQAAASYQQAAAMDPKSAPAELGWARTLARQGKLAESESHFRQAAALDPLFRNALLELGDLYQQNHQPNEAIAIYREFPDDAAAQERLSALLLAGKQYADAIPRLEEACQKDPSVDNLMALADAYLATQQSDKAMPLLEKSVAAAPSNYEIRMVYAGALRDRRQYAAAATQFQAAARLKPDEPKTWLDLGGMYYLAGDYPHALPALEQARQLGDKTPGNWFLTAIMLDKEKQLKPALDAYQHFLAVSKDQSPDQEFQARQRAKLLQRELEKR